MHVNCHFVFFLECYIALITFIRICIDVFITVMILLIMFFEVARIYEFVFINFTFDARFSDGCRFSTVRSVTFCKSLFWRITGFSGYPMGH